MYYANGALAYSKDAEKAQWKRKIIEFELANPSISKYIGTREVAYNTSHSKVFDYYEIFLQKVDENSLSTVAWSTFVEYVGRYIKNLDHVINFTDAVVKRATTADLSRQVTAYKQSILNGHGVISVSFGQGNFFTNSVFVQLDSWMKPYFRTYALATPSSTLESLSTGGNARTLDNDTIVSVPYRLGSPIVRNPKRYIVWQPVNGSIVVDNTTFTPCPPVEINDGGDALCFDSEWEAIDTLYEDYHNFDYYMSIFEIQENIHFTMKTWIEEHLSAPSPWVKDRDIGCGCSKQVWFKHIGTNEVLEVDVLSFNEDGKMYQAPIDNSILTLIKGSYAGVNIIDDR